MLLRCYILFIVCPMRFILVNHHHVSEAEELNFDVLNFDAVMLSWVVPSTAAVAQRQSRLQLPSIAGTRNPANTARSPKPNRVSDTPSERSGRGRRGF